MSPVASSKVTAVSCISPEPLTSLTTTFQSLTTSSRMAKVEAWNLDRVKARFRKESPDLDVEAACAQYQKYMVLTASYTNEWFLVPPLVDAFLHIHLLFTRDYANFCHQCLGTFMHHEPLDNCLDTTQIDAEKEKLLVAWQRSFGYPAIEFDSLQASSSISGGISSEFTSGISGGIATSVISTVS